MTLPTTPNPSAPRRSHSALISIPLSLSSPTLRGRAESSASSSDSSWTLQTPQSPSIMAVLDIGRKRAGSDPLLGHGHQEPFETTLPIHHPKQSDGGASFQIDPDGALLSSDNGTSPESYSIPAVQRPSGRLMPNTTGQVAEGRDLVTSNNDSTSIMQSREFIDNRESSTQPASRTKRAIPPSLPLDGAAAEQSDDPGAKQGRRLRPRLRSIISAPLAHSRHSSKRSLAKVASALSSRQPSIETDLHTASNQSGARFLARQDSQLITRAGIVGSPSSGLDEEAIWIQRKSHQLPMFGNPPRSPIPANRSIPPTLQRGITSPIPARAQVSDTVAVKDTQPRRRLDHFERILPKELQVMIMGKLLEDGASRERDKRWSGEVGARRELIRLSRVSKSWRKLCFDGQLWTDVDLAPFAAHLQPCTMRQIFNHTAPFISNLSLRNMSAFSSWDISSALADRCARHALATLVTLDLRCSKIDSRAITAIIQNAPRLRNINLKGVQAVNLNVLQCVASCSKVLESLDVSGCWAISLEDVRSYVEMLNEECAAGLKSLRLDGVGFRSEDVTPADSLVPIFVRLLNLETLSLQGCRQLHSPMLDIACYTLRSQSRMLTIRHLNLSGCTQLRADIFPAMSGLLPELRYLELAGMPAMFQENSQSDRTAFNRFLETIPKLERLDIEETCGTCLDDSTLTIVARAPNLTNLQIGFASKITPGAMVEFIRSCPTLKVFEADNTQADAAVMREFQHRHPEDGKLSLIDCRAIQAADYLRVPGVSRPREGFTGYTAIPMAYSELDLFPKAVIKAFWSWRRVTIPRGWEETLAEKEKELAQSGTDAGIAAGQKGGRAGRGRGWRRKDDSYDAKGLCIVQ